MQNKHKQAFTLAEVVIAVAIIGTLAALTIPTYFASSNAQKKQYVSGVRKTYLELADAANKIKINNAGIFTEAWSSSGNANDNLRNLFSNQLKFSRLCDSGTSQANCWPTNYYKYDGSANGLDLSTYSMAVLNSGAMMAFKSLSTSCTDASVKNASNNNIGCAEIITDINGTNAPNRFGKDIFKFFITPNKIIPNGDTGTPGADCPNNGGLECSANYILGNIPGEVALVEAPPAPPEPPACTPTSETQTVACDAGYTGNKTQKRDFTCPAATWGAWYDTDTSGCVAAGGVWHIHGEAVDNFPDVCVEGPVDATVTVVDGYNGNYNNLQDCQDAVNYFWANY